MTCARWRSLAPAVPLAFALLGRAAVAEACDPVVPEVHVIDENERAVDKTPPSAAVVTGVRIARGQGASAGDCGDLGVIQLQIAPGVDDRTDASHMGYQLAMTAGSLPNGLLLPADAVRTSSGAITLSWSDGPVEEQRPVEFTLSVTAIDLGGNAARPTSFEVNQSAAAASASSGGAAGPACALGAPGAGGAPFGAALAAALAAMAGLRARARRRHGPGAAGRG